jgi:molybdopterin synthase sulfur carrier subunit
MDRILMIVEVKFFTRLREITGKKVEKIQLQNKITVNGLIRLLGDIYGEKFREYIYDKEEVQDYLSILVNGKNTNKLLGLDTKLQEGDVMAILPPVGGG